MLVDLGVVRAGRIRSPGEGVPGGIGIQAPDADVAQKLSVGDIDVIHNRFEPGPRPLEMHAGKRQVHRVGCRQTYSVAPAMNLGPVDAGLHTQRGIYAARDGGQHFDVIPAVGMQYEFGRRTLAVGSEKVLAHLRELPGEAQAPVAHMLEIHFQASENVRELNDLVGIGSRPVGHAHSQRAVFASQRSGRHLQRAALEPLPGTARHHSRTRCRCAAPFAAHLGD